MPISQPLKLVAFILSLSATVACKSQDSQTNSQFYESEKLNFTLEPVVEGLSIPWGLVFFA